MPDDYLWDRSGPSDPDAKQLEDLLAPLAHDAPLDELHVRRAVRRRWPFVAVGSAMVAIAAGVALWLALPARPHDVAPPVACTGSGSGFRFVGLGGEVACGNLRVAAGVLPVGGVLDTGAHQAELTIADIGHAQLGANTRVFLESTGSGGHHLSIDHGHLHARVNALPRLFTVSTKAASVVDLGCEYSIDVDATGVGSIRVFSGMVELTTKTGSIVVAPAGTHARILAGRVPGLPIWHTATAAFEAAVDAQLAGDPTALGALLSAATATDAITLVNLAVVDEAHRRVVVTRLAELSAPPDGITLDSALANPEVLRRWQDEIVRAVRVAEPANGKIHKTP